MAEFVFGVLFLVSSFLSESALPPQLRAYEEAQSGGSFSAHDLSELVVFTPLIIVRLVARVGLFFFWRPARLLFLITIVADLLLTPFFGPSVDAGWSRALEEAAIVISGMVLCLVYFSSLRDLYGKRKVDA